MAKTEIYIVFECFCRIGMNLRLRQKMKLSQNILQKGRFLRIYSVSWKLE